MSLVGTRPILQDELQKYELHHRARIAIKPGITGMWQVSGRSDITDFTDHHTVRLPLRVNWGGGWSDTPPYCNEKGGTVLNAAILLNGEKPVEVTLERIPEQKVVFDSA